ncbi:General transcription factor IIH subunit 3 [Tetrabaena socialis]|uniref:General transcription and DNA repair factor IIH subunit TFB4 n=1 Tax=Tetrabaena socialis TaxID=47790 RepID=A0A2J7ZQX5_9CHLO|nr:General transcription factor IIH subunit 3 [Tetrabaena socialis]|eukprot:PNH02656.1 General transcription factor IIH subunit 3 [Tetrabaena socialis]
MATARSLVASRPPLCIVSAGAGVGSALGPLASKQQKPSNRGAPAAASSAAAAAAAAARAGRAPRPRVLCLLGSPDAPMQYIPVMNAIFSAQRAEVAVDALVMGPEDSSFLQQAAHLTGGLYFRPPSLTGPGRGAGRAGSGGGGGGGGSALLGVLLSHFAADTGTRAGLDAAQALGVDFRASCFCHKYVIESGYVCSVCLSIFCQPSRACSTCGTAFTGAGAGAGAGVGQGAGVT